MLTYPSDPASSHLSLPSTHVRSYSPTLIHFDFSKFLSPSLLDFAFIVVVEDVSEFRM